MELLNAANGATCHHFVVDEPTIASLIFGSGRVFARVGSLFCNLFPLLGR